MFGIVSMFLVSGCANANRTHLKPGEDRYEFTINHSIGQHPAFLKTEQALAELGLDSKTLAQPETGYFMLRPIVTYRVGGPLGNVEQAQYALRIQVTDARIALTFDLGAAHDSGWTVYPPETEMSKIRAKFTAIAAQISDSVNGSLVNPSADQPAQ
jgi:hypothetical protein